MASAQPPLDVVIIPLRFCQQALARAIRTSGAERVYSKDPCIMCKARDLKILASIPGIDWVAVVTKVTRKFSGCHGRNSSGGSRTILPGERFHIKVIQTAKVDCVEGHGICFRQRACRKAGRDKSPAGGTHQEADRVILAVIGKS